MPPAQLVLAQSDHPDRCGEGEERQQQERPPVHPRLPEQPLLTHAHAALETLRGRWSVAWRIERDRFRLGLSVPPGCTARLDLPDGSSGEVGAGTHREERALADLRR